MANRKICILGGTGFVGHVLCERLVRAGHDVRVITRRRERHKDLLVLPTLSLVEGDVANEVLLRREFADRDIVINLVGILNERGHRGSGFEFAHVEIPRRVVAACQATGVRRLLHMSALGAGSDAPSYYQRSKASGEALVHAAAEVAVTTFRPSVIFGRHDSFINRFAGLLRRIPVAMPLACPQARFQPVWVEDVVSAYVRSLDNHRTFGQSYELCGPRVYTLRELVIYISQVMGVRRQIIGLNDALSHLQAALMEYVPGKPFSLDNYRSLKRDNVCSRGFPELFGVTPTGLEEIIPAYLSPRAAGTEE